MAKVMEVVRDGKASGHMVFCPGCRHGHVFDERWHFNGNMEKPTFNGSMLANRDDPKTRCHSYVKDGMIQFLADCGHALKGQTVPLEDF
jgi:hypothetical protein